MDLDPNALKRLRVTVPKLGLIPWVVEAVVVAVLTKYLLNLPWIWGFLLGSVVAAVSPAVVVPCLFRLRAKGYGVAKVRSNRFFSFLLISLSALSSENSCCIIHFKERQKSATFFSYSSKQLRSNKSENCAN